MKERQVQSLGWEDLLEKEMATHPNILAWAIPWTEEPSGLQSMGSQKSQTRQRPNSSIDRKRELGSLHMLMLSGEEFI